MTQNKRNAEQELARRVLARRRLIEFVKYTYHNYIPGSVHHDICQRLERFSQQVINKESPRLMLTMPPRHGKLLSDDTLVPTSTGFKTHGELAPGDLVVGSDGNFTRVVAVSKAGHATHRLTTAGNVQIDCHLAHEWGVWQRTKDTYLNLTEYKYVVKETKDLLKFLPPKTALSLNKDDCYTLAPRNNWNMFVPTCRPDNLPYPYQRVWAQRKMPRYRYEYDAVAKIEPLPKKKRGRCIQVEAEDGLYCVTPSFLLTHNSELASIRFPAWHLGHHPSHEFIVAGYSLDLPMKFSRKTRDLVRDQSYQVLFPGTKLDQNSQSVEAWSTLHQGAYRAVGVGGPLTGHGAHILVIDDPFKNLEEADSQTIRDKVWDWYQSAAYTRLAPGGGALIIQCMTGDTPVLMADGTEKELRDVRPDDRVATYDDGDMAVSTVLAHKSFGDDVIYEIRTVTGRKVRANDRHPFLAYENDMPMLKPRWVRTKKLVAGNHRLVIWQNGSFISESVESVKYAGIKEVFDVTIRETHNFIANGIVSHNTRWNDDDLAGKLLEAMRNDEEADQWEVVNYPAIAEYYEYVNKITMEVMYESAPIDPPPLTHDLFREKGQALHPDRFSEPSLRKIQKNLHPRIWSALYQQNPVPDEGLYFQKPWFKHQDSFPEYSRCRIITAWDFAIGEKQQNDWTVGVTLLHDPNDNLYLIDVTRFKGDTFTILTEIMRIAKMFNPSTALEKAQDYILGVEDGQIWKTLRPLLEAEMSRERLPVTIHPLPTLTDKMARARALQSQLQRGKFYLPPASQYDFVTPFVSELLRFPGGKHDDQVDAAAHAARLALEMQPPADRRRQKAPESWKDKLHSIMKNPNGLSHMSS